MFMVVLFSWKKGVETSTLFVVMFMVVFDFFRAVRSFNFLEWDFFKSLGLLVFKSLGLLVFKSLGLLVFKSLGLLVFKPSANKNIPLWRHSAPIPFSIGVGLDLFMDFVWIPSPLH